MNRMWIVLVLAVAACGGSLSEEQRKEMREAREQQTIQKVSDAEILAEAFARGRAIMSVLEKNPSAIDSLKKSYEVEIRWLAPTAATGTEIEKQVIEAYLNAAITGQELTDNVQRVGSDSMLYTQPSVVELPDGAFQIKGTWNITLSKKNLVLGLTKK